MRRNGSKQINCVLNHSPLKIFPRLVFPVTHDFAHLALLLLSDTFQVYTISKPAFRYPARWSSGACDDACSSLQEGIAVLALHRSARSDLFFEGVVTDSGPSSYCKVKFTEGRAKGHTMKVWKCVCACACAHSCVHSFLPGPFVCDTRVHHNLKTLWRVGTVQCELDDVNKISTKRCSPEELRRWCPRKEVSGQQKSGEVNICAKKKAETRKFHLFLSRKVKRKDIFLSLLVDVFVGVGVCVILFVCMVSSFVQAGSGGGGQVVSFELGDFVLIEGPDDSCWVAQLLEPYTGKLSEEVDDVDDDGPRISLRWLYTPDELPRYMCVCVCERGNAKEFLFC